MIRLSTIGRKQQRGFTIMELLIATAILSVILLLITTMMISIGNLYYKGINGARVQDAVRNITDGISHDLQLTNQHVVSSAGTSSAGAAEIAYCVADVRYTVSIGHQITSGAATGTQVKHVLWRDTLTSNGACAPVDLNQAAPNAAAPLNGTNGAELIPVNSRLTNFNVTTLTAFPGTYNISVGVAYGDDDLICSTDVALSCTLDGPMTLTDYYNPANHFLCKGKKGGQFCATAALNTTVVQRINNN